MLALVNIRDFFVRISIPELAGWIFLYGSIPITL